MDQLGEVATMVQPRRGRLLGPMLVTGSLAVYSFVMALIVDDGLYRALYALVGIQSGWVSGVYLGQYTVLTRFTVLIRDDVEAPDRETLLARLNRGASAYPNLWPSGVPIVVTAISAAAAIVVTLLNVISTR